MGRTTHSPPFCDWILKVAQLCTEQPPVHFERLVLESGDNSITFDLHPRLTVISGLSQMERDGVVNEFVGALGNSRSGVHLELTTDDQRRLAVFRPNGAPHRVVDIERREDVTDRFADAGREIDLLEHLGLDPRSARRTMRFDAKDLTEATEHDLMVQTLAHVDQGELWDAADALHSANETLQREADATGSSVEDAEVIERIETRHAEFERSQAHSEQVRRLTFVLAGLAALLSMPVVSRFGTVGILPVALIAAGAVAASFVCWRRMEAARVAEEDVLSEAGAQSYLGFHLQRVNSLLSSDINRRRLMSAAESQRSAAATWSALAGEIDVEWALTNRLDIVTLSTLCVDVPGAAGPPTAVRRSEDTTAIAHAVMTRLNLLRSAGDGGESLPALLDEPFANVDSGALPALLELMVHSSEFQQIVLLTESQAVASWARVEAMTGAIGIIEPAPSARPVGAL